MFASSQRVASWSPERLEAWISGAGAVTGSATGDLAELTASSCDREYSCRIGSISGSGEVRVATPGRTSPFATVEISIGFSAAIAEDSLTALTAETSALRRVGCEVSAVCSITGPTPDPKTDPVNDGDSGSVCRDFSPE